MMARRLFSLGFAAALLTAFGCSSGGDGGTTPAQLVCKNGGAVEAIAVIMLCGGSTDGTTETINLVLNVPASETGNTTLRGLNFDVMFDESNLMFVAGSQTGELFDGALVGVALSDPPDGHVVVTIQQKGDVIDPVSVGAGQHAVFSLSFQRVAGSTFAATRLTFVNFEATDASPAIDFLSDLELSYQQ